MWINFFYIFFLHSVVLGRWRRHILANEIRPCGLPPEYSQLPSFAQTELRNIWKDYKSGTSCTAEKAATDDILTVAKVFASKYPLSDMLSAITPLPLSFTSPFPLQKRTKYEKLFASNNYSIANMSGDHSTRYSEELYAVTTLTSETNTSNSNIKQGKIRLYSKPSNNGASNSIPLEDLAYELIDTDIDDTYPTFNPERKSDNYDGYILANGENSVAPQNSFVYNELPISENFELPEFLKDANEDVISAFMNVWNDPNIPSEGLRQELVHLLAVSQLNSKQLTAYNKYATELRRRQREFVKELSQMSPEAQDAIDIIAFAEPEERFALIKKFPYDVRRELRKFVRRRARKYYRKL